MMNEPMSTNSSHPAKTGWDHTISRLYPYLDHVMAELEIRQEWVNHVVPVNLIMTYRIGGVDALVLPDTFVDAVPRNAEIKGAQYLPDTSTILFATWDNDSWETYTRSRILRALVYELRRVWQYYYHPELYHDDIRAKADAAQYADDLMDSWTTDVDLI